MKPFTIKQILKQLPKKLKSSTSPQLDVEILVCFVLNKPKEYLHTHGEVPISKLQITKLNKLINRRAKGEPIAYIIGTKEFFGLNFKVNKYTLIPRPETEILVEEAIKILVSQPPLSTLLIDIGTGSGCIPISILKSLSSQQRKKITCLAIDISPQALNIAKQNAQKYQLNKSCSTVSNITPIMNQKIIFLAGDLLEPLMPPKNIRLNPFGANFNLYRNIIITANLPYLPSRQYRTLDKTITKYEPENALIAGKDGLKYYRKLFQQIKKASFFLPTCRLTLFFEIDPSQSKSIKILTKKYFPNAKIKLIKDLADRNRLAKIYPYKS